MTKIIFVLRHAQSADKQSGQTDYDRLLTASGKQDAAHLGDQLKLKSFFPDKIISSTAIRSRQTIEGLNLALRLEADKIHYEPDLYEGKSDVWFREIATAADNPDTILIAGHNPSASSVASILLARQIDLAPCECIGISLATSNSPQTLIFHFTPHH